MAENVVANVMDQFRADLELHVLQDIVEISESERTHHSINFRTGSDATVIELNWHGTCCVGKVLHPVFFQDSEPSGMRHILTKFCKEINLLRELKHPNIVQFMGLYYRQSSPIPILVMERMECSLTKFLDTYKKGSIPDHKAYSVLCDVVKGLVYLHEVKGIAHRDLSSNNILVTSYLCAKIADLGSARVLNKPGGWNASSQQLTVQPGTQDFMPPEALEDPPQYDLSVDVFSFGCVIIHLTTHQWPRPVGQTLKGKIISEFERRRKFIDKMGCAHPLFSVVEICLHDAPNDRPTSMQVLELLASKQQSERIQLQDFVTGLQSTSCIDKMRQEIEGLKVAVKKKDTSIKGLQDILKREQLSHQEKLRNYDHDQQKLTQMNEKMHKKIEELNLKCEQAQIEHEELQKYKETVISLEHDLRKSKQVEADLYKKLDEALKDIEDISSRYRSLQNENTELKRGQSAATFSGMDDSQLTQELAHKNTLVEILHGEIKTYSDSLDKEKRKVSMLTLENQNYQHQLQQLLGPPPPLPPRPHNYPSMKTQPMPSSHQGSWEGVTPGIVMGHTVSSRLMPGQNAVEPSYYSEGYKQYDTNAGRGPYHFRPRSHTIPQCSSEPYSRPGALSEPCPVCGKKFSTTEQLTVHASHCNFQQ